MKKLAVIFFGVYLTATSALASDCEGHDTQSTCPEGTICCAVSTGHDCFVGTSCPTNKCIIKTHTPPGGCAGACPGCVSSFVYYTACDYLYRCQTTVTDTGPGEGCPTGCDYQKSDVGCVAETPP